MKYEEELLDHRSGKFMEIVDIDLWDTFYQIRKDRGDLENINHALPLRVIQSKGVEVRPDVDINVNDLNSDFNTKYKQFYRSGDGGIKFKVDVIIHKNDVWGYGEETPGDYIFEGKVYSAGMRVVTWLHYWYSRLRPVYVVSDAIDVPNGVYVITDNPTRKQDFRDYTVWSLEFTTYNPLTTYKWKIVESEPKQTTKSSSSTMVALKDCAPHIFISLNEKKTGQCNRTMQQKLCDLGYLKQSQVTGWYDAETMNAVKQFQRDMNKKGHNLLVDGVMGPVTLGILVKQ